MRERRFVRIALAVLALALVSGAAVVGYFVAEPPPLPVVQIAAARFALQQARLAPPLAPEALAIADTLGAELELLYARERSKLVRFRRSEVLARAAMRTQEAATTAREAAEDSLERGLDAAQARATELRARLDLVAAQAGRMPAERMVQRSFRRARVALESADAMAAHRQLAPLAVALDTVSALIGRAERTLGASLARLHDPGLRAAWQSWVDQTVAETKGGRTAVLVEKLRRRCVVVQNRRVIARYEADFGRNGLADKLHAGDGATPEGRYYVKAKNDTSRYHKALLIDYPNASDLAAFNKAKRTGRVPRGRGPGGLIEIHGSGGRQADWTEGCIALRNADMDELFRKVPVGTPITIVGAARLPGD